MLIHRHDVSVLHSTRGELDISQRSFSWKLEQVIKIVSRLSALRYRAAPYYFVFQY